LLPSPVFLERRPLNVSSKQLALANAGDCLLDRQLAQALWEIYARKPPEALMTAAGITVFADSNAGLYACTAYDAISPAAHDLNCRTA
jgi:hypothetical protein